MEIQLASSSASCRRRRRIKKTIEPSDLSNESSFIVDDIIIDILSRLPAKDVLRFRCVCMKWRDLTSTRDFTDLHRRRSYPLILKGHNGLALLDKCWETPRLKIHKQLDYLYQYQSSPESDSHLQSSYVYFSHNGLIVSQGDDNIVKDSLPCEVSIVVYNPIYLDDVVNIIVPERCKVYGVFFHPVHKEYCTLWQVNLTPWKVQYRILNLESNPHWRDIGKSFPKTDRIWGICPVLIDKGLYWVVEPSEYYKNSSFIDFTWTSKCNCDIIEYDIRKEEFWVIPCPVPVTVRRNWFSQNLIDIDVNLIDIDGAVSLVQVFPCKKLVEINIWTLKDQEEVLWTNSQYIISTDVLYLDMPRVLAVRNEELILQAKAKLYVCNLKLGTCRKSGQQYEYHVMFLSHVTSLVFLRNCMSTICMSETCMLEARE